MMGGWAGSLARLLPLAAVCLGAVGGVCGLGLRGGTLKGAAAFQAAPALARPRGADRASVCGRACPAALGLPLRARQLPGGGRLGLRMTAAETRVEREGGFQGVGPAAEGWGEALGMDEEGRLPEDEGLLKGALPNGFRYTIRRNCMPPGRFFSALIVHAGSVDEADDQQGIAHYLEHMLFLGTEQYPGPDSMRTILGKLGMSQLADANAYTDFRSTVYTLTAPTRGVDVRRNYDTANANANRDTLFRAGLVDKPVTIQTAFNEEEEEQEEEAADEPASVVEAGEGGATNVETVVGLLHQMAFRALIKKKSVDSERGAILSEYRDTSDLSDRVASTYYRQMFNETVLPKRFPIGKKPLIEAFTAEEIRAFYDTHYFPANMHLLLVGDVDPEAALARVESLFGPEPAGPRGGGAFDVGSRPTPAGGAISDWPLRGALISHDFGRRFRKPFESVMHRQITDFTLTLTVKEPLERDDKVRNFREEMLDTLAGMALDFRTDEVVQASDEPPFTGVDWYYFNSAREGCALNTLTISSEVDTWREAVVRGLREVRRLERFGVTEGELDLLLETLVGRYRQDAEQTETTQSSEWLDEVLDSVETGSSFLSPTQAYDLAQRMRGTITADAVNARLKQIFGHIGDADAHAIFVTGPEGWGDGVGEEAVRALVEESGQGLEAYEGGAAVPEFLLEEGDGEGAVAELAGDDALGLSVLTLGNGVHVTVKPTDFEVGQVTVHVSVPGGRALGGAALFLALSALGESGLGGMYPPALVTRYCALHEIDYSCSCESEHTTFELSFSSRKSPDNTRRAFEALRLLLGSTDVDEKALRRAQRAHRTEYEAMQRSLEGACAHALYGSVMLAADGSPDERFLPPHPDVADRVTAEEATRALREQLVASQSMEVTVVGDFDPDEVEQRAAELLCTLPRAPREGLKEYDMRVAAEPKRVDVRVHDDVLRTSLTMCFGTVNRYGVGRGGKMELPELGEGELELLEEMHGNMFINRCLIVATDIVNNRLYQEIREKRGMVYSVGIQWDPFYVAEAGLMSISLQPFPERLEESEERVKEVVRSLLKDGFSEQEFEEARAPIVQEIRESLKSNAYWVGILEGVNSGGLQPKSLDSIRNIPELYLELTSEEVLAVMREAMKDFEDRLVVCTGISDKQY